MAYTIRMTTPADGPALQALRRDALTRHPEVFGSDLSEEQQRPPEVWTARATPTERSAIFVAVDADGALAGMAGMLGDGGIKTGHVAMLWGVYVRPEARGARLAAALTDACLDWGRAKGFARVRLQVLVDNAPAIRTYVRAGFTVYGVEPDVIRVEGVGHDELLMLKTLA